MKTRIRDNFAYGFICYSIGFLMGILALRWVEEVTE